MGEEEDISQGQRQGPSLDDGCCGSTPVSSAGGAHLTRELSGLIDVKIMQKLKWSEGQGGKYQRWKLGIYQAETG